MSGGKVDLEALKNVKMSAPALILNILGYEKINKRCSGIQRVCIDNMMIIAFTELTHLRTTSFNMICITYERLSVVESNERGESYANRPLTGACTHQNQN